MEPQTPEPVPQPVTPMAGPMQPQISSTDLHQSTIPAPKPKMQNGKILILIIVFFVAVIIGTIIFLIISSNNSSQNSQQAANNTNTNASAISGSSYPAVPLTNYNSTVFNFGFKYPASLGAPVVAESDTTSDCELLKFYIPGRTTSSYPTDSTF